MTDQQKEFIRQSYHSMTNRQLSAMLGITEYELYDVLNELGLRKKKVGLKIVLPASEQRGEFFEHDKNLITI
jgi:hypothetical protein